MFKTVWIQRCLDSPCGLCAAGAVRHGAVGEASRGVPTPQEAGRGALWRGVGGSVDRGEQEGGHKDAETRYGCREILWRVQVMYVEDGVSDIFGGLLCIHVLLGRSYSQSRSNFGVFMSFEVVVWKHGDVLYLSGLMLINTCSN